MFSSEGYWTGCGMGCGGGCGGGGVSGMGVGRNPLEGDLGSLGLLRALIFLRFACPHQAMQELMDQRHRHRHPQPGGMREASPGPDAASIIHF